MADARENNTPRQNSRVWRWVSTGIAIALLAGGAVYVARHWQDFARVRQLSPWVCAQVVALALLSRVALGWATKQVLLPFGTCLKFHDWFGLTMAGSLANYAAPFTAGAGFRALYLKRAHNTAYAHFISGFGAIALLGLLVSSGCAAGTLGWLWVAGGLSGPLRILAVATLLCFGGAAALVVMPPTLPLFENRWLKRVGMVVNGWQAIAKERGLVCKVILAITARMLLLSHMYYLMFQALGINASWAACWVTTCLGAVCWQIQITPGALGVYEGVLTLTFAVFGIARADGLMIALIYRAISSLLVLSVGGVYSQTLTRRMAKSQAPDESG